MSPLSIRGAVGGAALSWGLLVAAAANADAAPASTCDVKLDPRMAVYMVTVGDRPYRNKRYITFDDAVKLRDVLVSAGACQRVAVPRSCELKLLAAGDYAVMRDGMNFDRYAKLRTLKQAKRYARRLEKLKLCARVK